MTTERPARCPCSEGALLKRPTVLDSRPRQLRNAVLAAPVAAAASRQRERCRRAAALSRGAQRPVHAIAEGTQRSHTVRSAGRPEARRGDLLGGRVLGG